MESLFQSQETRLRDSRGRFATRERAYADKAINENKKLRYFCEKYKRAWFASQERAERLERELNELRNKIKSILL